MGAGKALMRALKALPKKRREKLAYEKDLLRRANEWKEKKKRAVEAKEDPLTPEERKEMERDIKQITDELNRYHDRISKIKLIEGGKSKKKKR